MAVALIILMAITFIYTLTLLKALAWVKRLWVTDKTNKLLLDEEITNKRK